MYRKILYNDITGLYINPQGLSQKIPISWHLFIFMSAGGRKHTYNRMLKLTLLGCEQYDSRPSS